MNLFQVAFGLIRDAVGNQVGKEVSNLVRPPAPPQRSVPTIDVEALLAEHRAETDAKLDAIVRALRQQNAQVHETLKRQRTWNLALTSGLVITLVVAILALR